MSESKDASTGITDQNTTRDNAIIVIVIGLLIVCYAATTDPLLSKETLGPLAFGSAFIAAGFWSIKVKK